MYIGYKYFNFNIQFYHVTRCLNYYELIGPFTLRVTKLGPAFINVIARCTLKTAKNYK